MRAWMLPGLALGFLGCGGPDDADDTSAPTGGNDPVELTWVEGFAFGWDHFNHRLSHLEARLTDDGVSVAVIGGTSTTGVVTELPSECEEGCDEFPFYDQSDVSVSWARATAPVAWASGTAELVVGADGGTTDLVVTLQGTPADGPTALITGLVIDTDEPLDGDPACYRPENGWLPRRILVGLGAPSADGATGTIPVEAAFEGGNTLEAERACIDEVKHRARVRFTVDVLVVSADAAGTSQEIARSAAWEHSGQASDPGEQVPPEPVPVGLPDTALTGWSRLDYRFHVDDPEDRGAYVRTLEFVASPAQANGTATNYSPFTQLSGFDFQFEGTVVGLDLGVAITRGVATGTLPAELDDAGDPIVTVLPFE